jgi:ATP-dependent Zn protease
MASAFPQYFLINRLNISGASGVFHAKEVERNFWPHAKMEAHIKISFAGAIAQKILFKETGMGCEEDLERARNYAYNMFNKTGFSSCWETLPTMHPGAREETFIKRRKLERKIERFLKKCEKDVYKYLKKNLSTVRELGELLFSKKHLKSSEIWSVINK